MVFIIIFILRQSEKPKTDIMKHPKEIRLQMRHTLNGIIQNYQIKLTDEFKVKAHWQVMRHIEH